ncbi:hypothetical protein HDU86_001469 [Geranomyces michiganensis]|nr:hypothetical protein HDU86_001469 [Geranomyces michiganensis]
MSSKQSDIPVPAASSTSFDLSAPITAPESDVSPLANPLSCPNDHNEWTVFELRTTLLGLQIPICGLGLWSGKVRAAAPREASLHSSTLWRRLGLAVWWAFIAWGALNMLSAAWILVKEEQTFRFPVYREDSLSVRDVNWAQSLIIKDVHFTGALPDPRHWDFYLFKDNAGAGPVLTEKVLASKSVGYPDPLLELTGSSELTIEASWGVALPETTPEGYQTIYTLFTSLNGNQIRRDDLSSYSRMGKRTWRFTINIQADRPAAVAVLLHVSVPYPGYPGNLIQPVLLTATAMTYDMSSAAWKCEAPHISCGVAELQPMRPARAVAVYTGERENYPSFPNYYNQDIAGSLRLLTCVLIFGPLFAVVLLGVASFIARLFLDRGIFVPMWRLVYSAISKKCAVVRRFVRNHSRNGEANEERDAERQPLLPESQAAVDS